MSIPYTEDQKFNVIQIDNFRSLVFGLSEVQLWISGTNVIPDNIDSLFVKTNDNGTNYSNAVDGNVNNVWYSSNSWASRLIITLNQSYNMMDIESFVVHIPSGYENSFGNTRFMFFDNDIFIYANTPLLTYPSIYRFDGPAIENVSTFATSSSDFNSNIPDDSSFSSNMIIQPIVIPYRPQGYAPTELIYTQPSQSSQPSQTKYDIQFQYKHDDTTGDARRLTIEFYIDDASVMNDTINGGDQTTNWQTYNKSFVSDGLIEKSSYKIRLFVGGNTTPKPATMIKEFYLWTYLQTISVDPNFNSVATDDTASWKRTGGSIGSNQFSFNNPNDSIEQLINVSTLYKYNNGTETDSSYVVHSGSVKLEAFVKGSQNNSIVNDYTVFSSFFFISRIDQDVLIFTNGNTFVYSPTLTVPFVVSGGSGTGALTYAIDGISDGKTGLEQPNAGTYTIVATKAEDVNYLVKTATQTITIEKATQAAFNISNSGQTFTYDPNANISFVASGGSGTGAITYTVNGNEPSGTTIQDVDTYSIVATKSGDANYESITSTATITIEKSTQAALVIANSGQTFVYDPNTNISFAASGGSGTGAITYTVNGNEPSGTTIKDVDTYSIVATKSGDANYESITSTATIIIKDKATQDPLVINNSGQTVTFVEGIDIDFTATGGSGTGAITYIVDGVTTTDTTLTTAGTYAITATKAEDTTYESITSSTTITINQAAQATLDISNSGLTFLYDPNANISFAATGGSGTGAITYTVNDVATTDTTLTTAGTYAISAAKAGDTNYNEITSTATITINQAAQAAFVIANSGQTFTFVEGIKITFTASGGSGTGAITYTVDGVATTDTTLTTAGEYDITATKAGDTNYESITTSAEIVIKKIQDPLVIANGDKIFPYEEDISINFTASGGSGSGETSYDVTKDGTAYEISEETVLTNPGAYVIVATKEGGYEYFDISSTAAITITKRTQAPLEFIDGSQTIEYTPTLDISYTATGGSGTGQITYTVNGISVDNDDTLTQPHAGTYVIVATKAGDSNFNPRSSFPVTITITQTTQGSLTVTNSGENFSYTPTLDISYTATGGNGTGEVTYTVNDVSVGTVDVLTAPNAGTYVIVATNEGDINYQPISSDPATITVTQATQTPPLTITNSGETFSYTPTLNISYKAIGGKGTGEVTYTVNDVSVGTVDVLTAPDKGTYVIVATKTGDRNYQSSGPSDPATITITKADQDTLSISNLGSYAYSPSLTLDFIAVGGSGTGAITYQVNEENVTSTLLIAPSSGVYNISVARESDTNFNAADVSGVITIVKATQNPLLLSNATSYSYSPTLIIYYTAVGGNGIGEVTYTVNDVSVGTVDVLTAPDVGTYMIVATKAGDDNYNERLSNSATYIITKVPQSTLVVSNAGSSYAFSSSLRVNYTAVGGNGIGEVTYTVNDVSVGTVDVLTAPDVGTYRIVATKEGDNNYDGTTSSEATIRITEAVVVVPNPLPKSLRNLCRSRCEIIPIKQTQSQASAFSSLTRRSNYKRIYQGSPTKLRLLRAEFDTLEIAFTPVGAPTYYEIYLRALPEYTVLPLIVFNTNSGVIRNLQVNTVYEIDVVAYYISGDSFHLDFKEFFQTIDESAPLNFQLYPPSGDSFSGSDTTSYIDVYFEQAAGVPREYVVRVTDAFGNKILDTLDDTTVVFLPNKKNRVEDLSMSQTYFVEITTVYRQNEPLNLDYRLTNTVFLERETSVSEISYTDITGDRVFFNFEVSSGETASHTNDILYTIFFNDQQVYSAYHNENSDRIDVSFSDLSFNTDYNVKILSYYFNSKNTYESVSSFSTLNESGVTNFVLENFPNNAIVSFTPPPDFSGNGGTGYTITLHDNSDIGTKTLPNDATTIDVSSIDVSGLFGFDLSVNTSYGLIVDASYGTGNVYRNTFAFHTLNEGVVDGILIDGITGATARIVIDPFSNSIPEEYTVFLRTDESIDISAVSSSTDVLLDNVLTKATTYFVQVESRYSTGNSYLSIQDVSFATFNEAGIDANDVNVTPFGTSAVVDVSLGNISNYDISSVFGFVITDLASNTTALSGSVTATVATVEGNEIVQDFSFNTSDFVTHGLVFDRPHRLQLIANYGSDPVRPYYTFKEFNTLNEFPIQLSEENNITLRGRSIQIDLNNTYDLSYAQTNASADVKYTLELTNNETNIVNDISGTYALFPYTFTTDNNGDPLTPDTDFQLKIISFFPDTVNSDTGNTYEKTYDVKTLNQSEVAIELYTIEDASGLTIPVVHVIRSNDNPGNTYAQITLVAPSGFPTETRLIVTPDVGTTFVYNAEAGTNLTSDIVVDLSGLDINTTYELQAITEYDDGNTYTFDTSFTTLNEQAIDIESSFFTYTTSSSFAMDFVETGTGMSYVVSIFNRTDGNDTHVFAGQQNPPLDFSINFLSGATYDVSLDVVYPTGNTYRKTFDLSASFQSAFYLQNGSLQDLSGTAEFTNKGFTRTLPRHWHESSSVVIARNQDPESPDVFSKPNTVVDLSNIAVLYLPSNLSQTKTLKQSISRPNGDNNLYSSHYRISWYSALHQAGSNTFSFGSVIDQSIAYDVILHDSSTGVDFLRESYTQSLVDFSLNENVLDVYIPTSHRNVHFEIRRTATEKNNLYIMDLSMMDYEPESNSESVVENAS